MLDRFRGHPRPWTSASGQANSCCLDLACEPGSGDPHCWPPGPSLSGAGWGVPRCLLAPPLPPVLPRTPPTSAIPEPCPLCSDTSCCHVPTLPWPAWHLSPCPGGTGPPPSPSSRARLPLPELRHAPGTDSSPLPLAAPCVVVGLVTIQWESMTLGDVSCEVRSLRRTPQKDVSTCSPRWLHSPAGEERAKAWASDKGQSSTLVAEGPQGFCPRPPLLSWSPRPRRAAVTPLGCCCHHLPVTQGPEQSRSFIKATGICKGDSPWPFLTPRWHFYSTVGHSGPVLLVLP